MAMVRTKQIIMIVVSILLLATFFLSRAIRLSRTPMKPAFNKEMTSGPLASEAKMQTEQVHTDSLTNDFSIEELMGKVSVRGNADFKAIEGELSTKTGLFLRAEALTAFEKMSKAAAKEGISLKIISAYRSFDQQKVIWENKWSGRQKLSGGINASSITDPVKRATEILKYSSMPGTSRHHWGTDIDINSLSPAYFKSGRGLKEYQWLKVHGVEYGFCQPYTKKGEERLSGYEEEQWHWSYCPLSSKMLREYNQKIKEEMLQGFLGSETAREVQIIRYYVNGIHKDCQ